jgi:hypothetical protein
MNIITLPHPSPEPSATLIARSELGHLNASLARRVEEHSARYAAFWDANDATPDEILAAMGGGAIVWLACAAESVGHISRIAAIVGLSLTDFLPADRWQPRRGFVVADGRVTLEPPVDGCDPHGLLIPLPPDLPAPDPTDPTDLPLPESDPATPPAP